MNLAQFLKLIALSLASATALTAETLTFDDLTVPSYFSYQFLPDSYHQIDTWSNFGVVDGTAPGWSGTYFPTALVSSTNEIFNVSGHDASISNSTAFDLTSGYFTAGWTKAVEVQITGYNGASLLYDNTYTFTSSGPLLVNLNYLGVTDVIFHPLGPDPLPYLYSDGEFVVDNLTINTAKSVPESGATASLLAAALFSLAFVRRRQS